MKIFYRQAAGQTHTHPFPYGLHNFMLKKLSLRQDARGITKKTHHHTHFELHLITHGTQVYTIGEETYTVGAGDFLLICPHILHRLVETDANMEKYSITFHGHTETTTPCHQGTITPRMQDSIDFAIRESQLHKEISPILIESCILEIIISVLRLAGMKEKSGTEQPEENAVIELAKQYIDDNIETAPDVTEVSKYCYLSTKQLTRIFTRFEGISPGEYIKMKRIRRIEQLLATSMTLKEISERMNFSNEYYFNAFFKKQAGLPPGEFRKTLRN